MGIAYAENAAMAKAKAMYGKRLRMEDYQHLLQMKSVGEVAGYLKKETAYSEVLSGIQENLIHRGQLENLIRRRMWDTLAKFLRYSRSDGLLLRLYTMQNEIEQLLSLMRHLRGTNTMEKYKVRFPGYLAKYFSFDLYAAAQVTSFDELLRVLDHTVYHRLLLPLRPSIGNAIDIPACERELRTHYYSQALEWIEEDYGGEARKSLTNIFHQKINFYNFSLIYRMKKFFGKSPEEISRYLIPCHTNLRKRVTQSLVEAPSATAFLQQLEKLPHIRLEHLDYDPIGEMDYTMRKRVSQKEFRFSTQAPVVLISYMNLLDTEIHNIINVIEGIRYGVSPEEIHSLLDY
ncbi:V-type ATPase subunit [Oscillospiraceae bacterium MB08-C2-2]|nr:V-type ATPase subunit [Oscillospiraceae bacterium MB08-C2-2]